MRNRIAIVSGLVGLLVGTGFNFAFALQGGDTLLFEDFQNQTIPATWVNLDRDSLSDQNGRPADWYVTFDDISSGEGTPNYVLASNSWFNPAGTAENWLIMDSVTVCDTNLYLIWKSAPFEGPVFMDGYEVRLSTTGNHPDSMFTTIGTWAEGIGATAMPTPGEVHTDYQGNRGVLREWRLHLGPWLGQRIWLAFVHTSEDDNLLMLDDVTLATIPPWDAVAVSGSYSTEYPIFPLTQAVSMNFSARVGNNGFDTIPVLRIDMQTDRSGTPVFTANDSIVDLPPFSDSAVTILNPYTPSQTGTYTYTVTVDMDSTEGRPGDESTSTTFMVSDSVMARDDGVPSYAGNISLGANSGFVGQTFSLQNPDTLTSISFLLKLLDTNDTIRASVYAFNGTPGQLIATTPAWIVPNTAPGWFTVKLENDTRLGVGTYLIGLEETAAGELFLGYSENKYTLGAGWRRIGTTWGSDAALGNGNVYMIRANFGTVNNLVAAEEAREIESVEAHPNPSKDVFRLSWAAPLRDAGQLEVYDPSGRLVLRRTVAKGLRSTQVDLGAQAAGAYHLYLRSADRLLRKQLILSK